MGAKNEIAEKRVVVRRAFVSVHDKTGLAQFASFLAERGIELCATEGTAGFLRAASVPVRPAEEITGFAELLSGKVKSLSPRLHAGILFSRDSSAERAETENAAVAAIDMVIVNFYPFRNVTESAPVMEATKMIDIGGPAALRAAAKNFRWVVPVPEPASYDTVMKDMLEWEGSASAREPSVSLEVALELAVRTFAIASSYDRMIRYFFSKRLRSLPADLKLVSDASAMFPERVSLSLRKLQDLRYGENPHQAASVYVNDDDLWGRRLQGKELSFNNLLDLEAAVCACREFEGPSCVIVKHRSPCGASQSKELMEAYTLARDCDPLSAFGGVVAVNRPVTEVLAMEMSKLFLELIAAPSFDPDAVRILSIKKNLRLVELTPDALARGRAPRTLLRSGPGGVLLQEEDLRDEHVSDWKQVTKRAASAEEREGLFFLWKVARHVVSNGIVIGKKDRTLGIGAGQTSRVDAVEVALMKAGRAGHDVRGAWLVSDGFFPFRDSIDAAARAGIVAVIEPGGSVRDGECILAADEHDMVMYFTGRRSFKH